MIVMGIRVLTASLVLISASAAALAKLDIDHRIEDPRVDFDSSRNFNWSDVTQLLATLVNSIAGPSLNRASVYFEKLGISSSCRESMLQLVRALRDSEEWALLMVDASGKIPGGVLDGTIMDFGSMDECLKVKVNGSEAGGGEIFRGRFCMVQYHSALLSPPSQMRLGSKNYSDAYGEPPKWASDTLLQAAAFIRPLAFWLGTCVPSTCSQDDIRKLSASLFPPLGFNVSVSDCRTDEPYVWPSNSVAAMCALGILVGICSSGTVIDCVLRKRDCMQSFGANHILLRIPLAFSLLGNTQRLFRAPSSGGRLSCLHGIRFITATWIVLHHTYNRAFWPFPKYRGFLAVKNMFVGHLATAVLESETIMIGSFFFMSGFLLVYSCLVKMEKSGKKLNFFMVIIHKYWRVTPAVGLTMALLFVLPVMDSGPTWNSTLDPFCRNCQDTWWANFLYINNWMSMNRQCLPHLWYLAVMMQLHIVGALLLIITCRWPAVGISLGSLMFVGCAADTVLLVVWNDFSMPKLWPLSDDLDSYNAYISEVYFNSCYHWPDYTIGMVVAYLLLRRSRKLSWKYQMLGWTLAAASALASVYGVNGRANSAAVRALFFVGHRIGWAAGLGWVVYACANGMGGMRSSFISVVLNPRTSTLPTKTKACTFYSQTHI